MGSVTVRFTKTGTHIRARGKDAQALFDMITKGLEPTPPSMAPEQTSTDTGTCMHCRGTGVGMNGPGSLCICQYGEKGGV